MLGVYKGQFIVDHRFFYKKKLRVDRQRKCVRSSSNCVRETWAQKRPGSCRNLGGNRGFWSIWWLQTVMTLQRVCLVLFNPTKKCDLGSELPGLGQIYEGVMRGFGRSDGHQQKQAHWGHAWFYSHPVKDRKLRFKLPGKVRFEGRNRGLWANNALQLALT